MTAKKSNGANLGFENQMWTVVDKLRGHMDASEYKHVFLGLIFLKYISDAFQARYKQLDVMKDTEYTDPEDRDEYAAANIFWVPKEARWAKLQFSARQPTVGKIVDDAMMAELSATRYEQFAEADRLEAMIRKNLGALGYGK